MRPGLAASIRRLVVAGALVVLAVVGWAAPAAAHTALAASTPGHRSSVPGSPATMRLVFTEPVDPALVSVTLRGVESGLQPEPQVLPADTESGTVVDFTLPALAHDTYGATWQSVGPDGHRATGEILFAVGGGVVDGAEALVGSGVSTGDRALDTAALIGRMFWYLAVAVAAGALFAAYHLRRATPDPDPSRRRPKPRPGGTNAAPADRAPALAGVTAGVGAATAPPRSGTPTRGPSTLRAATTLTTTGGGGARRPAAATTADGGPTGTESGSAGPVSGAGRRRGARARVGQGSRARAAGVGGR